MRNNRASRLKSSKVLVYKAHINNSSTLRILHKYGFNSVKLTTKYSLTLTMMKARLEFYLAHKD